MLWTATIYVAFLCEVGSVMIVYTDCRKKEKKFGKKTTCDRTIGM